MIGASPRWKNIVLQATDSGNKNSILWSCCVLQNKHDLLICCAPCSRGALQLAQQPACAGQEGAAVVGTGMRGSCRAFAWVGNPCAGFCCLPAGSWTRADLGCVTCCMPLGLPGCCGGKLCLKRCCSLQLVRGFQHGAEQVCSGYPGSAVLFGGHVARSAQKRSCKASRNLAVTPKTAQWGIMWWVMGGLSPQAGCLLDRAPLPTSLGIYIILKSAAMGILGL